MPKGQHICPNCKFLPRLLAAFVLLQPVCVHADVCEPQCHPGRGICVSGQCFCHNPWGGVGCSSVVSGVPAVTASKDAGFNLPTPAGIAVGETILNRPLPTLQSVALPQLRDGQKQELVKVALERTWGDPRDAGVEGVVLPNSHSRKSLRSLTVVQEASAGQVDVAKRRRFSDPSQAESILSSAASKSLPDAAIASEKTSLKKSLVKHDDKKDVAQQLRDGRISLRQDLELFNTHANMLKLRGDPIAVALLRDLDPVRTDLQLLGTQAKSNQPQVSQLQGYGIDSTTCIATPISVQGLILAVLLGFAAIDQYSKKTIDGQIHRGSWACGCCLHLSRFVVRLQWHTIAFGIFYLLVMNGTWAVMCLNGTAADYLKTVGIYAYLAFAIFGLLILFLSEIYLRCTETVERFEHLSSNVSNLVGLLDVKYGKQLQKRTAAAGHWAGDKVDDMTDALGVTEASSEDDVSCWNGCRAPVPKNTRK